MLKKHYILLIIFLILSSSAWCNQWQEQVDSLKALIAVETSDATIAELNLEIAEELMLNQPENSYKYLQDALISAEKIVDTALLYECNLGLSDFYSIMNNYESSLEYLYLALDLIENDKSKISACHNRLSEIFYFNDDMDKSIYHSRIAIALDYEMGDTLDLSYDFHNIGTWHLEKEIYDSALYYLYKAIQYHSYISDESNSLFISHLGQTFTYMDQFDSALYYHFKALHLDSLYESEYEVAIDENYISNTYLRKKDYDKAIYYANKSLDRAEAMGLMDIMHYNYEQLYLTYKEKGDFKTALEYAILQNNYADSLREKNKEVIIQGLDAKYRFNQQKQQIELQNIENLLLRKQKTSLLILSILGLLLFISALFIVIQVTQKHKAKQKLLGELKKANSSKDKLISVISHDLRSSIGTIRNSFEVFRDKSLDQKTKDELLESFFPVVDSTYDLLENLLTWANYGKDDLKPSIKIIDIKPILEKAIHHTQHLADSKQIEILNKVNSTRVLADTNMLATIIRNLISNAVKFSNPNSQVIISSFISDETVIVNVKDNGIGMKPEVLERIFVEPTEYHSKGTRGERGSGLGLSMCKSFIETLKGRIWAKSEVKKGSTFFFSIPLA